MKPFGFWVDMRGNTLSDPATSWIHALPFGTYQHPVYGEMVFDASKLTALANSVTTKVRGIDPDIDYDHKADAAKGNQAAGWVKNAEVRGDGLYLQIDWTASAAAEIKEQKYRYFSADFADEWTDAQGVVHKDVLLGGGLTNRPYMKNLVPVNLSELRFDEPPTQTAPPKGDEVDAKQLRAALGLSETATDAEVTAKLTEGVTAISTVTTLTEKTATLEAEVKQLKDPTGGVDPALRQLVDSSPAVAKMLADMEAQKKQIEELQAATRLAETEKTLTEIQKGKQFALTPVIREELKKVLLASTPAAGKTLTELVSKIVDGSGLVDLSERGYTGRRTGEGLSDAGLKFSEQVRQLMEADKNLTYGDAVEEIARKNPALWNEYRENSYVVKQ